MQALVTPLLYKHMQVFAEHLDLTFLRTLKAGHPGLPHVRTLRIRSNHIIMRDIRVSKMQKAARSKQYAAFSPPQQSTRLPYLSNAAHLSRDMASRLT
jgi:hypothetical protein